MILLSVLFIQIQIIRSSPSCESIHSAYAPCCGVTDKDAVSVSCPTGCANCRPDDTQLSSVYCDTNNDMIADTNDRMDPPTLYFTYGAATSADQYNTSFQDLFAKIQSKTGKQVKFYQNSGYAETFDALLNGRVHVAGVSTGSVPTAVNCLGFVPLSQMTKEDGSYGYEMIVIVKNGSDINSIQDLKSVNNLQFAFVSSSSNSGYKTPNILLREMQMEYTPTFSGDHTASIWGVANGTYTVAATASSIFRRMVNLGAVNETDIKIIYTSQTFPTTAYGMKSNLNTILQEQIKSAFLELDNFQNSSMHPVFSDADKFSPVDYKTLWEIIRTVDRGNNVTYCS